MRRLPILLLLMLPLSGWALPGDSEQPIEVEADRLEVRDEDNRSIYQAHVTLVNAAVVFVADLEPIRFDFDRLFAVAR